jgi:hypothetical protein
MSALRAFDLTRFQRLVAVEGGLVTGTFAVMPATRAERESWVKAYDVVLWSDDEHSSGLVLYSNDLTCAVRDGAAELSIFDTRKEAAIRDAWPHLKVAVEGALAAFPAPEPANAEVPPATVGDAEAEPS